MSVVVRFAPSPTGFLHIGGARTALFNYLFARAHQGTYLLRVEDTDQARSTSEAIDAIINGLNWLGLVPDQPPIFQSKNEARHREVAHELVKQGKAYYCYTTSEELSELREKAQAEGKPFRYDGVWRDRLPSEAPEGVSPAIRLKVEQKGSTTIQDLVQGEVSMEHAQLDDMVLLRADGTPTYMHAVVVDDHDMGITHIIRGDDHLNNAFRQIQLYKALGWDVPAFAHIPLIHGSDGAKLSKRHGALGVEAYEAMGFLPEAICNYLLRLGWSHGNDEVISMSEATQWFDMQHVGKSPSRFDMDKLSFLNNHYIRIKPIETLVELVKPLIKEALGTSYDTSMEKLFPDALNLCKDRVKSLHELVEVSAFFFKKLPFDYDEKACELLKGEGYKCLKEMLLMLTALDHWDDTTIQAAIKDLCEATGKKMKDYMMPLRAALTGSATSPSVPAILAILKKDISFTRIEAALA